MVAIFTARKPLEQIAFEKSAGIEVFPDQHLYPDAQFKGPVLYSGRVRVTMPAPGGQVSFELLDGLYADGPIIAADEIFIETADLAIAGAWTVGTVTDPSADVDPLDPPAQIEIVQIDPENTSGSHATVAPNRTRGRIDTTVDARISAAVTLLNANLRARGTLGFSNHTDNLRQLTFQGTVSGSWIIGSTVTGGTSGATGKVVGLGPAINQGLGPDSFGFFVVVDMGLDYAGPEWDVVTPDVVTSSNGAVGTLKSAPFAGRSTGVLFRPQGNPAYISGAGITLFQTSGSLDFISPDLVRFPNPFVDFQNGIFIGDSVQFDDAPVAGQVFKVIDTLSTTPAQPTWRDTIRVTPSHGQAATGSFQSPIDVFYDPDLTLELLATQVELDTSSPSLALITIADGRTWSGIGVNQGDDLRTLNSGNPANDVDFRVSQFQDINRPDDRGVLPGNLSTVFVAGTDSMDIYRIKKVAPQ